MAKNASNAMSFTPFQMFDQLHSKSPTASQIPFVKSHAPLRPFHIPFPISLKKAQTFDFRLGSVISSTTPSATSSATSSCSIQMLDRSAMRVSASSASSGNLSFIPLMKPWMTCIAISKNFLEGDLISRASLTDCRRSLAMPSPMTSISASPTPKPARISLPVSSPQIFANLFFAAPKAPYSVNIPSGARMMVSISIFDSSLPS